MSARIEIVPPQATCDPHPVDEECVLILSEQQCVRVLAPSSLPHHLRLVASNGRVLASSEDYADKAGAKRAVRAWLGAFGEVWETRLTLDTVRLLDIDGRPVR